MNYDIIAAAENLAFWVGLNGVAFAEWVLEIMSTIEIEEHEFSIADYFTADELKEHWDDSYDLTINWLNKPLNTKVEGNYKISLNTLTFWMTVGIIAGIIKGRNM